eukprot:4477544-Ditylum_brightwellii.AAC.1
MIGLNGIAQRFHFYETIWFYQKSKVSSDPWKKARWLGFAKNSGDEMMYYIKTEEDKPRYLVCLIITSQRKNVGTDKEYVNEDQTQQSELKDIELDFLNLKEEVMTESEEADIGDQALIES